MTYKIWVWQLGDIFVVGVPGEPYTELQVMIREAVPEKHVIVSVNTNGATCRWLGSSLNSRFRTTRIE